MLSDESGSSVISDYMGQAAQSRAGAIVVDVSDEGRDDAAAYSIASATG